MAWLEEATYSERFQAIVVIAKIRKRKKRERGRGGQQCQRGGKGGWKSHRIRENEREKAVV